jgi:hypothetical protein
MDAKNKEYATGNDVKKVINLSNYDLKNEEVNILKKGLGFSIAPKTVPIENIICSVEDSIKNLSDEDKNAIRQDCALVLKKAKPPKSNISKMEHEAIKNLRNNENIVILKADKGGATVVMNRIDYNTKMIEHLTTTGSYKKLNNNPISKIIKEVKKVKYFLEQRLSSPEKQKWVTKLFGYDYEIIYKKGKDNVVAVCTFP